MPLGGLASQRSVGPGGDWPLPGVEVGRGVVLAVAGQIDGAVAVIVVLASLAKSGVTGVMVTDIRSEDHV